MPLLTLGIMLFRGEPKTVCQFVLQRVEDGLQTVARTFRLAVSVLGHARELLFELPIESINRTSEIDLISSVLVVVIFGYGGHIIPKLGLCCLLCGTNLAVEILVPSFEILRELGDIRPLLLLALGTAFESALVLLVHVKHLLGRIPLFIPQLPFQSFKRAGQHVAKLLVVLVVRTVHGCHLFLELLFGCLHGTQHSRTELSMLVLVVLRHSGKLTLEFRRLFV
mmetsp:Transcript_29356/g.77582  ORF Transcript_29356/g.77582 Transcript_29356/m.77582 type:complete len:224 (-) Transcript_29356:1994-2665(-)